MIEKAKGEEDMKEAFKLRRRSQDDIRSRTSFDTNSRKDLLSRAPTPTYSMVSRSIQALP